MPPPRPPITEPGVESLLAEHEPLLDHVEHIRIAALELPSLSPEERRELLGRILDFLQGKLATHAEHEERTLYPWIADLLGDPRATAPMTYDHDAIRRLTARLKDTSVHEVPLMLELYGLHALIVLHFRKEEELYQPLLDANEAGTIKRRNGYGDD